jgi:transposase
MLLPIQLPIQNPPNCTSKRGQTGLFPTRTKRGMSSSWPNPRQVKLITESTRKDDRLDAQTLARLARIDPALLRPIQHRSEKAQTALMVIRVRAALMSARTSLVNTARGLAQGTGRAIAKV